MGTVWPSNTWATAWIACGATGPLTPGCRRSNQCPGGVRCYASYGPDARGDGAPWESCFAAVLSMVPLHPLPVAAQTQVPVQAVTNHSSEVDDDDETPGVPA